MNRLLSTAAGAVLAAASFSGPAVAADQTAPPPNQRPVVVHRLHGAPPGAANANNGTTGNGISYNGGPVILGGTNIYYIWYGDWSQHPNASLILDNFANNVGGSPYFNINTTYYDGTNTNVTNKVTLAGNVTSTYVAANPTNLADGDIWSIVTTAFSKGLAQDPNGVYFVLTAPGVGESTGFLSSYCGWHTAATYNGVWIKYSFVGDANGIYACTGPINGPTADVGAGAMASVIAHELEEATSDPLINAWYSGNYQENADKCAWTFGSTFTANGATANMNLGTYAYLIQQNWVNAQGGRLRALLFDGARLQPDVHHILLGFGFSRQHGHLWAGRQRGERIQQRVEPERQRPTGWGGPRLLAESDDHLLDTFRVDGVLDAGRNLSTDDHRLGRNRQRRRAHREDHRGEPDGYRAADTGLYALGFAHVPNGDAGEFPAGLSGHGEPA